MHAKFAVLATAFALALARPQASTTAPSAGSTDGISPCILGCATKATQCKLTDVSCVCTNTDYQNSVAQCIQSTCADQAQAAQQVQAAQCAAVSGVSSVSQAISSLQSSVSSKASALSSSASSALSSASSAAATLTGSASGNAGSKIEFATTGLFLAAGTFLFGLGVGGAALL